MEWELANLNFIITVPGIYDVNIEVVKVYNSSLDTCQFDATILIIPRVTFNTFCRYNNMYKYIKV